MNRRCALAACLLAATAGCAMRSGAQPATTAAPSSYGRSGGDEYAQPATSVSASSTTPLGGSYSQSGGAVGLRPPAPVTPSVPAPSRPPARGDLDGTPDGPALEEREARLTQLEAELQQAQAALAATLSECRNICLAAGNVCAAAREICRLTGDLAQGAARDARCQRARTACIDAGRRRDGACPACPAR